jgi:hypothetical protein
MKRQQLEQKNGKVSRIHQQEYLNKSFNETPKLNSYFFQAHSPSCTHNGTKQHISPLKSKLQTMTTMLYFLIQR